MAKGQTLKIMQQFYKNKPDNKILLSHGNKKVGKDTIIINITSAANCPSRKKNLCQLSDCNKCYALKAERFYPASFAFRNKQAVIWDHLTAKKIADQIKLYCKNRKNIKYLRFSESGDFKNQKDIVKMNKIADMLTGIIKVYGYTARRDLKYNNLSSNIVINGSGFMVSNRFIAVYDIDNSMLKCKGNCRLCRLCTRKTGKTIQVLMH